MGSKAEKKNRKTILKQLKEKDSESFLKSLPVDKKLFRDLFDYLSSNLGDDDCNNDMVMTLQFLTEKKIENRANVIQWLHDHGAYCDCEVLSNVEQQFEDNNI